VQGRIALAPCAGARVIALGRDPDARWVTSGRPRHAHLDGFDLHGNVTIDGEDREHLEQLCRYLLRPAVAQDRLRLTEDGRVVLELKAKWTDGTSHLVFERATRRTRDAPGVTVVFLSSAGWAQGPREKPSAATDVRRGAIGRLGGQAERAE
jgi:hypothetical protein